MLQSICFCFDSVADESFIKIRRIWGIGSLKYNLLVETDVRCLL